MLKKMKLRLTLMNSAVFLAILTSIVIFVFISFQVQATESTDNELMNDAYMLKRYVSLFENQSSSQGALYEEYNDFKARLNSTNISYGIWDVSGHSYVYISSYSLPLDPLAAIRSLIFAADSRAVRESAESDGTYYLHLYRYGDVNIRVCTTIAVTDSGQMRIIQTIQNMHYQENMNQTFRRTMLLAIALGFLLSLVTGYFIAGNSMKPVEVSMQQQKSFIADASHELRTPITIMRTNLDVARSCPDDPVSEQMEWIDSAYRETEHMQLLVDNLLQIAKSDAGSDDLSMQQFFAYRLCRDVRDRFVPIADRKGIRLWFDDKAADSVILTADYNKMVQLLSIVLDNAIKYSSPGQDIRMSLKRAGQKAVIAVEDHGIGIDKSELENIFNRFYRTDKARSRKEGGSGLGLAIAKQITEAHGGTITADSVKGRGTTITITLPAA